MVSGLLLGFLGAGLLLLLTRPPKGHSIVLRTVPPPYIKVSVKGAVQIPGVYNFEEYSRVEDAIDAAGGFREDADLDSINLAGFLEDGMQIVVPQKRKEVADENTVKPSQTQRTSTVTPQPQAASSSTVVKVVNINTASIDELITLPRIGESTARKIIQYREMYGSFQTIEDLQKVSGIGETVFEAIKPYIIIQP